MGIAPLNHREITAWSDGMQYGITPFERRAVIAVDRIYRIHRSKEDKS